MSKNCNDCVFKKDEPNSSNLIECTYPLPNIVQHLRFTPPNTGVNCKTLKTREDLVKLTEVKND